MRKISILCIIAACFLMFVFKSIIFKNNKIIDKCNQGSDKKELVANEMFEGQWNLTNTHSSITSTIVITEQDDKGFHFVIDACYFMHSDTIEGDAEFESPESAKYVDEGSPESSITFILLDNILTVEKEGSPISPGVDIEGKYTLEEPTYVNADILETVYTEAELTLIESLVPKEKYEHYFVFCSKRGLCEEQEVTISNGVSARSIYVFVPTAGMGYNIIITIEGNIYIQLFDDDHSFYTNDNAWESNIMPEPTECKK